MKRPLTGPKVTILQPTLKGCKAVALIQLFPLLFLVCLSHFDNSNVIHISIRTLFSQDIRTCIQICAMINDPGTPYRSSVPGRGGRKTGLRHPHLSQIQLSSGACSQLLHNEAGRCLGRVTPTSSLEKNLI